MILTNRTSWKDGVIARERFLHYFAKFFWKRSSGSEFWF